MISILTNDGTIRNIDQVTIALTSAMQSLSGLSNGSLLEITTVFEGPCCEHVGIYRLLDNICDHYGFEKQRIRIDTPNLIETHPEYHICRNFNFWELEQSIINGKQFTATDKVFDADFKHFGNFIGHSNKYRLHTASQLYARHRDKTLQSYHCDVTNPYHREYIGLEDLMFVDQPGAVLDSAYELIKAAPLELDEINTFPILQPANINLLKLYPKFFVEIVNLTFFSGNTFYVDEKIWRPMLALTPFMVQGPANLINNLKRIGFKTFHMWWDEGYSEDPDDCQVEAMLENVDRLSKLSIWELQAMYKDMTPTLEHNRNLLLSLTKEQVESVFK
jgi:hypothetical protein